MPLMQSKSKKAFSKNVATEMDAGKPQDQSLAIAYSIKKKNAKKMAAGGMVESPMPDADSAEHYESIADAILSKKRKASSMSDDGMVEFDNEEGPGEDMSQNMDAIKKENYDDSQLSEQPMDSNEHGDILSDEDDHGMDLIAKIRKKRSS